MTYDDWKLASPPEYKEDAPPAQPQAIHEKPRGGHRHYCHEWDLMLIDDSMPEYEACICYPPEQR